MKGGIVLWCFQGQAQNLTTSVNALIKDIFLQERGNVSSFTHDGATLKFKLDNEFELVFVVVYQSIIQLSYIDKLLTDVQLSFRDRYKNVLRDPANLYSYCAEDQFKQFSDAFQELLRVAESAGRVQAPTQMKTYEDSLKSKKTVKSMIQTPVVAGTQAKAPKIPTINAPKENDKVSDVGNKKNMGSPKHEDLPAAGVKTGTVEEDEVEKKRREFLAKMNKKPGPQVTPKTEKQKKVKTGTKWELGGSSAEASQLDYSTGKDVANVSKDDDRAYLEEQKKYVGRLKGDLEGIDYESDDDGENSDMSDEGSDENDNKVAVKPTKTGGFGVFSAFRLLVGSKKLSAEDIKPALDKMRDHLIAKNVAADIADKLCQSVKTKLEGKVIGTFSGIASTVKETVRESLVQLLSPQRRVDVLRDVMEAKKQKRPFVIVFCGVNGVGKSTNLAKITFWLTENDCRVLIAACDTFRAGAVEQLRTHTNHLNALHPNSVQLYDQGYGKDAAGVASQAISHASACGLDVVLVDTAGRMQDNEPLMRALAKLIRVNEPDLVLFVGEALVGNEAVDQLQKFNQALADNSAVGQQARLIDGIVLTKFDTIDDKVGAAISMTYMTGQPIVFVGTGQTYKDLKYLNANAVVHALLK